jgi:hypothetical protein
MIRKLVNMCAIAVAVASLLKAATSVQQFFQTVVKGPLMALLGLDEPSGRRSEAEVVSAAPVERRF